MSECKNCKMKPGAAIRTLDMIHCADCGRQILPSRPSYADLEAELAEARKRVEELETFSEDLKKLDLEHREHIDSLKLELLVSKEKLRDSVPRSRWDVTCDQFNESAKQCKEAIVFGEQILRRAEKAEADLDEANKKIAAREADNKRLREEFEKIACLEKDDRWKDLAFLAKRALAETVPNTEEKPK